METKKTPEQKQVDSKEEQKAVSRRGFITTSAATAAAITVAGFGSALASGMERSIRPGRPGSQKSPEVKSVQPGSTAMKKEVSTDVANVLSIALTDDGFRRELQTNPENALRARGISVSSEDLSVIQTILGDAERTQRMRNDQIGPAMRSNKCPYRGFHY